ncbi:MAG: glycoside hydrolase [Candidatus Altiarchaeales archaeon]|nr:glycoside hydrolase [Candidatus Altiarchaeales archaeon]MBD3415738.1 glycoside hydrolase [Candidatus Altiarchaeales archaeon]
MSLSDPARAVLESNDVDGSSTRPSPRLYPHQWLWDSCFIAVGYSHFNVSRAKREILSALGGQWENGMIPHIRFNPEVRDYFPSPGDWGVPDGKMTSGITQPPMPAIAAWEIFRRDRDRSFLEKVHGSLCSYHEYLHSERGGEVLFIVHPWESGMDNSPIFDSALQRIEVDDTLEYLRMDRDLVDEAQRPVKEHYDRYMQLLKTFQEFEYDIGDIRRNSDFIFEDVLFNSIWSRANQDLARICREVGEDGAEYSEWCERTNEEMARREFRCYDAKSEEYVEKLSCAAIMPLYADAVEKDDLAGVLSSIDALTLEHPICSYGPGQPEFDPSCYWRGPVWVNINWFLIRGLLDYGLNDLAREITGKTLKMIGENGFREYYNPLSGEGYGGDRFSWTAALCIDIEKSMVNGI